MLHLGVGICLQHRLDGFSDRLLVETEHDQGLRRFFHAFIPGTAEQFFRGCAAALDDLVLQLQDHPLGGLESDSLDAFDPGNVFGEDGGTDLFRGQRREHHPRGVDTDAGNTDQEFEEFTQDELALQWLSMCNRMPQKLSGIATRMKNMTPVILEIPALEVVVPNEIVKDEMELIKGSIVSTLRKYLHNNAITLTIRVAEKQEREVILTRKQQFLKMVDDNPAVGRLCELFDLVLT